MADLNLAGIALLATLTLGGVAAWVGRRLRRIAVVDVFWGLFFVVVAWIGALGGSGDWRRWLVAGLVSVWGIRLAGYIAVRSRGAGEDPRYVELLDDVPEERRMSVAVTRVFFLQAGLAWFIAMPVLVVAMTTYQPGSGWPSAAVAVGVLAWVVGFAFEAIGDAQLAAFKADPANRGRIMDSGLWAWTRHPNYFGDAAMWWGIWLIACSAWPGVVTVLSPALMSWFLVVRTGAGLLEKSMSTRPGYADYMARTSAFIPRPPRRPGVRP